MEKEFDFKLKVWVKHLPKLFINLRHCAIKAFFKVTLRSKIEVLNETIK